MKKLLKTLLIGIIICISGTTCVEAANLYNVNNYQLPLGTVKVVNNLYLFALYKDNKPYCVLDGEKMNKKDNLIGGQCTEYNAFRYYTYHNNYHNINNDTYIFWFREVKPNTFYKEARSMRATKNSQGLVFYGDKLHQLDEVK